MAATTGTAATSGGDTFRRVLNSVGVPLLAVFTALVLGGLVIWLSTGDLAKVIGPDGAFAGLWKGAVGNPHNIAGTLMTSTPYIFAGLSVALAFKCGLFNIGAEGQLAVGAVSSAFVGFSVKGLGFPLHMSLALGAGLLAGFLWGAIPGLLKAFTGAHEVIVTIMMNYIALSITQYLVGGPLKAKGSVTARTAVIEKGAEIPKLFPGTPWEMHWGVVLALLAAVLVWFFLTRTTWGFEIRTVGANPNAARYAGMSVVKNVSLAMSLAGLLSGAAGAVDVLGVTHRDELGFGAGYGFDSIAIALLARNNPFGVVAAALLFGGLKAGATQMQFNTQISGSIISVVQGLVLLFVAADVIIRWLYHLKLPSARPTMTLAAAGVMAEAPATAEAPHTADSSYEAERLGSEDVTADTSTREGRPGKVGDPDDPPL